MFMSEIETRNAEMLHQATRALAGVCDYAQQEDGVGYNGLDTHFGHSIAERPIESWTPKIAHAAWKMLRKYRKQLAGYGIDFDAITEPVVPSDEEMRALRQTVQAAKPNSRKLYVKDGKFVVEFAYDASLVTLVRDIPTRRWDPAAKKWTFLMEHRVVMPLLQFASKNQFDVAPEVIEACEDLTSTFEVNTMASRAVDAEIELEGLGGTLRPFQKAGVAYAAKNPQTFIADQMGLGKTVEAIASVYALNAFPAVITSPASLKLNWYNEVTKWLPGKKVTVIGRSNLRGDVNWNDWTADVIIINYDLLASGWSESIDPMTGKKVKSIILSAEGEKLLKLHLKAIICDESQYLKSGKAQRTAAVKKLSQGVDVRLLLTGTPLLNRPVELLSQLDILGMLNRFGGFWGFAKRYCAAFHDGYAWDLTGSSNLDELNEKLRANCYIRRLKEEVLTELPAKTRVYLPIELDNRSEYNRAAADVVDWLTQHAAEDQAFLESIAGLTEKEQKEAIRERSRSAGEKARRAEQLVKFEVLKQLSAKGKMSSIKEWVGDFIENEKLVLFAHHQDVVHELADMFDAPCITGSTPIHERQATVERFQNDPECRLVVSNIKAGGVGLTLTAASNVAFVEFGWNPGEMDQAEDRVHRIGQRDAVTAWYLVGEGTIDEDINALIEAKRVVVDAATEGNAVEGDEESEGILKALISRVTKK